VAAERAAVFSLQHCYCTAVVIAIADLEARMPLQSNNLLSFLLLLSLFCSVANAAWLGGTTFARTGVRTTTRSTNERAASSSSSSSPDPDVDAAKKLRQQAAKLREEVDSLEQRKRDAADAEQRALEQERASAVAQRERYSAVVPILKPDGSTVEERCDFSPRIVIRDDDDDDNNENASSFITTCEAALPLGILLGESEEFAGCTVVDEVAPGSNGEAAGLREGDIVRAITACQMTMETPTWQLMAGGIGVPKTTRFMYSVDGRPFEEVMDAVGSNRQDPQQRPMVIVIERRDES